MRRADTIEGTAVWLMTSATLIGRAPAVLQASPPVAFAGIASANSKAAGTVSLLMARCCALLAEPDVERLVARR